MSQRKINVKMLGDFSISCGEIRLDESVTRSRKVWLLLAYLLCNRERVISPEELIGVLWSEDRKQNAGGALKTTFWRARKILAALEDAVGYELVITGEGGYRWNPEVPVEVDAEEFVRLCREGAAEKEKMLRREYFISALELYRGDFLGKLSGEAWSTPISVRYQNMYLSVVLESVPILRKERDVEKAAQLCRNLLRTEPYHETLYQQLMLCLLDLGECQKAAQTYETMREKLSTDLGIMPNEESQAIYQDILHNLHGYALSPEYIWLQLRENDPPAGALMCEYSYFKLLYQAEARSAARRCEAVHVAVLSVTDTDGGALTKRRLDRAMEELRALLQTSLRRGDIVARCSISQYIIMLLQADYEDSRMVCDRILRTYKSAHPNAAEYIRFSVLPLEPLEQTIAAGMTK